uniref:Uncharacterized protein n=1 Tax=Panagrolaimus sp. JU765 TaxID=591449 RepID=A0AC34Q5W5_9BILA
MTGLMLDTKHSSMSKFAVINKILSKIPPKCVEHIRRKFFANFKFVFRTADAMASVAWLIFWLTIVEVALSSASSMAPAVQTKEIAYADPELLKQLHQIFLESLIGIRHRQPPNGGPLYKRASHKLEARSISQFKNCYFSPVQCILLERRRR